MLYLNDGHIRQLGADWLTMTDCIDRTVRVLESGDYAQPLKPYLRYGDPRNRIIAMPAYLGGSFQAAGLKWIASFPGNRERGLPRAHGVIVINRSDTGEPAAVLSGGLPSIMRTAAVSGSVLRHFFEARPAGRLHIGIIGWGPVGRAHMDMCGTLFGDWIEGFTIYDTDGIDGASIAPEWRSRTIAARSWQEAYDPCNVCITCTVSDHRYISHPPPRGSLLLNVSLRDYLAQALQSVKAVIVDDWNEVCRENTDIELLHRDRGLTREQTRSLRDLVCRGAMRDFPADEPVFFCPMGMAVFDLAIAGYLTDLARSQGVGAALTDS
jgi:2,3-diaminopropionate biosynthesis protein SbnB